MLEAEIEVRSRNNEVGASQILSVSLHIPVPSPFCEHGYDNLAQQEASHQGHLSTPRHLLSSKVASASLPPLHQVADIYSLNLLAFFHSLSSVCMCYISTVYLASSTFTVTVMHDGYTSTKRIWWILVTTG